MERQPHQPAAVPALELLRHNSTVELIDRAEAAGLVHRCHDPDDARLARVRLTADGAARLARLAPAHLDELRRLAPALGQLAAAGTAAAMQPRPQ
jgi:DNA-binding MarR family transcriptional regulator